MEILKPFQNFKLYGLEIRKFGDFQIFKILEIYKMWKLLTLNNLYLLNLEIFETFDFEKCIKLPISYLGNLNDLLKIWKLTKFGDSQDLETCKILKRINLDTIW